MRFFVKPRVFSLVALLLILNTLSFWVFYIPNYILEYEPRALSYFRLLFGELIGFLIIPLSSTLVYYLYASGKSSASLILPSLALAATKCVLNLPYYYLFETALGGDWTESVLFSLGMNALILALDTALILALSVGGVHLSARFAGKKDKNSFFELRLTEDWSARAVTVSAPEHKAFFLIALVSFVINIAYEIFDIVNHLEIYGSFRQSEINFIVFKFVFFIALLAFCYILQTIVYNSYRKVFKNAGEN